MQQHFIFPIHSCLLKGITTVCLKCIKYACCCRFSLKAEQEDTLLLMISMHHQTLSWKATVMSRTARSPIRCCLQSQALIRIVNA